MLTPLLAPDIRSESPFKYFHTSLGLKDLIWPDVSLRHLQGDIAPFDSRLRLDHRRPINGDGFGVGWYDSVYDEELGGQPCIFTSVTPAWNNVNLTRLAEKIKSPLVFAHVRATTAGSLSLDNCHPWSFGKLMFMHNGGIAEFPKIKRQLQSQLSDELFNTIRNGLSPYSYLRHLPDAHANSFTAETLRRAMMATIAHITAMTEAEGITEPSLLNFCVTDGESVVATRYISSRHEEAASLIASEPLTFEKADWMEIKTNHMVVITPKMNLLQFPIVDKYYVPPSDPAALNRGTEFAASKGFLSPRREVSHRAADVDVAENFSALAV
ncbi:uncharacterized protein FIBRA_01039 [Fibroporia radiculosa]|uniref:Glutamine amidotransferase type-2 domain-containing protein n=1 Tax=Fibroporia radiculosa TaxID=599839 RepID=J4GJ65_9APHY|nr:uncharacterized protein FIBRA_01039 [Fibroporia radiculosa]CCL99030.1 predicted protein [Fibroporia radiculosa]